MIVIWYVIVIWLAFLRPKVMHMKAVKTMKKIICLLACLLLPISALAGTEYCTLRELNDQVAAKYPNGWQEDIQTKWRTVTINTPIIIPDADQFPILSLEIEKDDPDLSALPGEGWTVEERDDGRIELYRPRQVDGPSDKKVKITSHHDYSPIDMELVLDGFDGKTVRDLISDGNKLSSAVCHHRYTWDAVHPIETMYNTCVKGKETWVNCFDYLAYQTFYNIPLIQGVWYYLNYDIHQNLYYTDTLYSIDPWGEISLVYTPVSAEVIDPDIPLLCFEAIKEVLTEEIEAGHIRKILEMHLGYMSMDRSTDPEDRASITRPYWHVEVWWCNKGIIRLAGDDPEYPTNDHGKGECVRIAIDAQTGEIIGMAGDALGRQKKVDGVQLFPGYLNWDKVE